MVFERIERQGRRGAFKQLADKALQLTGGPNSPPPPAGRNVYGELVAQGRADLFVTYCTNAVAALAEKPELRSIAVPEALNVRADYGLAVGRGAPPEADRFAAFVVSARARPSWCGTAFCLRGPDARDAARCAATRCRVRSVARCARSGATERRDGDRWRRPQRVRATQGRARLPGRTAGGDPALHAGARAAARLAARQSTRGAGVPAAGGRQPPGARAHHRPRQHREPGDGAGAEARPDRRQRLHARRPTSSWPTACRQQTGIPYALLDGRFDRIPASYLQLGELIGRHERARELAALRRRDAWPRCAAAASPCPPSAARACTTRAARPVWRPAWRGSINVEILEFLGLRNVAAELAGRTRERVARAGAALGSRGDRHHRPGLRRHGAREPAVARRARRARRPRPPVAQAAVRLGRLPAGRQSADRLVVAGQGGVPGALPRGPARAHARVLPALLPCGAERRAGRRACSPAEADCRRARERLARRLGGAGRARRRRAVRVRAGPLFRLAGANWRAPRGRCSTRAALRPAGERRDRGLADSRPARAGGARPWAPRSSVAGTAFQGLFRNPLVSPDILGASAGAALGAVLGIFFSLGIFGIQARGLRRRPGRGRAGLCARLVACAAAIRC